MYVNQHNRKRRLFDDGESLSCGSCHAIKNKDEFNYYAQRNLYATACKQCRSIQAKLRLYNLTTEEYDKLVTDYRWCPICGCLLNFIGNKDKNSAHVDHDKITGQVRGVLCARCNRGIGMFEHNTETLEKAVEYLVGARNGG
jgi:ribosomal protein S27AE